MAVAMQSVTHTARPADTASCAASSQVSLAGPAGSLPTQAWNWSMRPPSSRLQRRSENWPIVSRSQRERRAPAMRKAAFPVTVDGAPSRRTVRCAARFPVPCAENQCSVQYNPQMGCTRLQSRGAPSTASHGLAPLGPEFGERNRERQVSPQPGQGTSKDQPLEFAASGASGLAMANGPSLGADLFLSLLRGR